MKKYIIAIIFMALISPVFAQNNAEESPNVYCVNVSVEKIYNTNQGYIIFYRTQRGITSVGLPYSWFYGGGATKAEFVRLPMASDWPSMTVFYNNGELTHIRVYTHRHRGHYTWGNIAQGIDTSSYFTDEETITLKF